MLCAQLNRSSISQIDDDMCEYVTVNNLLRTNLKTIYFVYICMLHSYIRSAIFMLINALSTLNI